MSSLHLPSTTDKKHKVKNVSGPKPPRYQGHLGPTVVSASGARSVVGAAVIGELPRTLEDKWLLPVQ